MKKFLLLIFIMSLSSSITRAIDSWEGVYKLDNSVTIIRRPNAIQIDMLGSRLAQRKFLFRKGSHFNRSILPDDVLLSRDLDRVLFRKEVAKLGHITEATVNPPEDSVHPVQSLELGKKKPPITKKIISRPAKKAAKGKKKLTGARSTKRTTITKRPSTRMIRQSRRAAKKRIAETKRQPAYVKKRNARSKRQATPTPERTRQSKNQPVFMPRKLVSVPRLPIYATRRMAPPRYTR